jgi:hypothetical protein
VKDRHLCKNLSWFTTRFESRGALGWEEQWHARGTRVYIGSGLPEDKNPTSCVRRCIMIYCVETLSTSSFIGYGGRVYKEDPIGYNCIRPRLYLYFPILQDLSNDYL